MDTHTLYMPILGLYLDTSVYVCKKSSFSRCLACLQVSQMSQNRVTNSVFSCVQLHSVVKALLACEWDTRVRSEWNVVSKATWTIVVDFQPKMVMLISLPLWTVTFLCMGCVYNTALKVLAYSYRCSLAFWRKNAFGKQIETWNSANTTRTLPLS